MTRTWTIATFLAAAALMSAAPAGKLPPIGQRTYVLDGPATAPVKIDKDGKPVGKVYLKDPVHPGKTVKVETPKAKPRKVVQQPAVKSKAGALRFKPLAVDGHLRSPRVEFSRDFVPLDRADEPVTGEFFQKVFAPARDDSF